MKQGKKEIFRVINPSLMDTREEEEEKENQERERCSCSMHLEANQLSDGF